MLLYRIRLLYCKNFKLRKNEIGKELKNENKPCPPWLFKAIERSFREVFKHFSAQILRLMLPFLRLPWDLLLRFLHSKTEKTSKSGILETLPSWYILSLKPKGKDDCKNLIHFSSVLCLFIFFNLVDEFGSHNLDKRAPGTYMSLAGNKGIDKCTFALSQAMKFDWIAVGEVKVITKAQR